MWTHGEGGASAVSLGAADWPAVDLVGVLPRQIRASNMATNFAVREKPRKKKQRQEDARTDTRGDYARKGSARARARASVQQHDSDPVPAVLMRRTVDRQAARTGRHPSPGPATCQSCSCSIVVLEPTANVQDKGGAMCLIV